MEGLLLGNRYELIEKIGGGGMALVYKARCRLLNRFVAIKILRDEFTDDEEFVKRFRVEAQAAASLSHPNIVSIFDVGHEKNIHYIVMEYIDGITLKEYITKKGVLPWKEAVGIAIQICSAIEQAHKNHVIHRDIKPHNILLTRDGIAKVTDFGIARAVSSSTITMVGSTIGSVHYFSPEQARGGFTDEKSDMYSLGITIYEMITGRVPFDGESPVAVALKHIQSKADRPLDVNPDIPRGINDIVVKAIKKDQNQRYQSASELLADLQKILRNPNMVFPSDSESIEEMPTRKLQAVGEGEYIDLEEVDDIETERPRKKKRDKLSIWLGIITALIIGSIFFYIGIRIVIPFIVPEQTKDFVVDNYVDQKFTDVREKLDQSSIVAVDAKHVFSETIDKDVIISQNVTEGNTLKPGSSIEFEVSDGPQLVQVPEIAGKESRIGEQMLVDMDFLINVITENSETVGTGIVVRTEPAAGEQLKPGSSVTVVESLGPLLKQVKMPDLIGHTRTEAEKLINDNNLTIGKILPEGIVSDVALISKQYPLVNTIIDEGTPVDMTFDIGEAAATETTGQTGTDSNTPSDMTQWKIPLDSPEKYGDQIQVYVEATPSDTNEMLIVKNEAVAKNSFPITVDIPKSSTGTTHVVVKLDGVVVQDINY